MTSSLNHPSSRSRSLFWRLMFRSISVRRPQAALALSSLALGAAVTSMLLNLYGDARRKMTREFRSYGANVLIAPAAADSSTLGSAIPEDTLARLKPLRLRTKGLDAAPVLYVVTRLRRVGSDRRLPEFQNAVAVGTDFTALRRLFPSWQVEGTPVSSGPTACLVGARVAAKLRLAAGDQLEIGLPSPVSNSDKKGGQDFQVSGIVTTGASEDDQVFLPLATLQRLADLEGKISLVELSVPGGTAEVEQVVADLTQSFPGLEVRPVRQIVYSEGRVLERMRSLVSSLGILIMVIITLCVAATMTAIALERRRDIAVMKALGAGDRTILELFLGEGVVLGLLGGAGGFILGDWAAGYVAERLFGVTLHMVWWTLPVVCLSSVLVALFATSFPVRILRGVQPAVVLKGE